MKILIACEESQTVCKAFRKRGHEAYSADIQDCSGGHPEWHIKGDVLPLLKEDWDMMIAFPPCTYLTSTGARWLKDQPPRKSGALVGAERREAQREALEFVRKLLNADIDLIALENPVGAISTNIRKPDQKICPTQFGHKEPKKTCLWLKNLPPLTHTEIVEPEYTITKSGKRVPTWFFIPKQGPERQKMRSVTFQGIADAMAEQWSLDLT